MHCEILTDMTNKLRTVFISFGVLFSFVTAFPQTEKANDESFEGVITIASTLSGSKYNLKAYGVSENGEFYTTFYRKGKLRRWDDPLVGTILLEDLENDMAYYWSPETKKGIKYILSTINKQKEALHSSGKKDVETGETKVSFGFKLKRWKQSETETQEILGAKIIGETDIDYWAFADWGPIFYGSRMLKGFAFEMEWFQKMTAPLEGTTTLHQSDHVVDVKKEKLSGTIFEIPNDVSFGYYNTYDDVSSQEKKITKAIKKYRKKHGISATKGVTTVGGGQKKGEWDY